MKTQLTTLAIATAAVLGFSAPAQAVRNDSHRDSRSEQRGHYDRNGMHNDRDERGFFARLFSWPGRAGRTVVHSPQIVGETLSGRRELVSDEGRFFARIDRDEHLVTDRAGRVVRRSGEFAGRTARRSGEFVGNAARHTGDFAYRSGRTIVHTPQIIGESLSGRREIITRDGRVLSSRDRDNDRELVRHDGRGHRLFASND